MLLYGAKPSSGHDPEETLNACGFESLKTSVEYPLYAKKRNQISNFKHSKTVSKSNFSHFPMTKFNRSARRRHSACKSLNHQSSLKFSRQSSKLAFCS